MYLSVVLRIGGVLLMLFSFAMVPPALIALYYGDGGQWPFFWTYLITLFVGLICWLPVANLKVEARSKEGFLIVVLFWTVLGLFGSLPFLFMEELNITVTDAVFESLSGLTTTGATVLSGLDQLPHAILFYRHLLQWLGGIGLIVLAVAVLPLLGIGGSQLYRAETPGQIKESSLAPRITETAKYLSYIYITLTVACILSYFLAGMDFFDAVCHAFSTTSIGGFSSHDKSMAYFDSVMIESICMVFMMISAINFTLHFSAWKRSDIRSYFSDDEFLFYIKAMLFGALMVCLSLFFTKTYDSIGDIFRYGLFHTISIVTTTGFTSTNFSIWPGFLPIMIVIGSFMGGSQGSTGGGMKAIRLLILLKQSGRELMRLIHPNGVFAVKINNKSVQDRIVESIWGFIGVYIAIFVVMTILVMATGVDAETSFAAVAAALNNLGAGIAGVSANYAELKDVTKWILCVNMLIGRLEIFTLLVILSPMFWRK